MTLRRCTSVWALMAAVLLPGCGEQQVENVAADSESKTQRDETSLRRT